ncbi:hypothetical protein SARC_04071 [Sphaeroforma arctica JP610]|uniref:Uncharacterized protein n=1 Tax=Sphaeroforma arctica JP610 TaxID=667725 RepID=A0A0L0G635_9EUKA|nr:hypothetical protein SARC_04071 [Sphaeroforma arctica JP610]KNC83673.1 hypothetical protein SARC_04071 [Sphaeroforma arctica JP610]|eukprot:XP_014157575.1 hypothetical protein SARC_04071 [Sphaeroforma arctica JP610]
MALSSAPALSAVLRDCCDEFTFYENEPTRTRTPARQHAGNVQMGGAAGTRRKLDRDRHKRVPAIAAGEYNLAGRKRSSSKSYHCERAVHQVRHCEGGGCVRDSDATHTVLDQLNTVSYNYKTEKDEAHVGFIEDDISDG